MTNLQNGTPPKVKPAGGEARARYWQGVFAVDFVTICNKNSFWSLLSADKDAAMILSWHKRFGNGFRRVANGVFACVCVVSWTSFQQPRKGRKKGGGACRLSASARDHRGLAPASCQYGERVGCCNSAVFGIASKCNRLVWFLLLQKRRRKNLRQVTTHILMRALNSASTSN